MNPFRLQFELRSLVKFTLICGAFLTLFHWSGVDRVGGDDGLVALFWPLTLAVVSALPFMIPRMTHPRCRSCGGKCLPSWSSQREGICPSCRVFKLSPEGRRRVTTWWLIAQGGVFLALSFALVGPVSGLLRFHLDWPSYTAAGLGVFAVVFGVTLGAMVVRLLAGSALMARAGHALRAARACAGEAGEDTSFGRVTVYALGTKGDPSRLLESQLGTCRSRIEALVGEPVETDRPLRVLAFGARDSFDAFVRRAVLYSGNHDGVYIPWPTRTIVLTTEFASFRLVDRERVVRTLLAYDFLDGHASGRTPLWLQVGVASLVATGGDPDDLARLNRRMLAALARRSDLDVEAFFRPSSRTLVRQVANWHHHANFAAYTQLLGQSSSVGEYLAGRWAPADRRERLRRFLKDLGPRTPPEEAFERHFGHGFAGLLEPWRAWVAGQGVGTHTPPPLAIRDAIVERVIPVIESRGAPILDRIQAIRELGKAGYAFGAERLIERLRTDGTLPKEELVWSLESIAGLALGDDVRRWQRWWMSLPPEATGVAQAAAPEPLVSADVRTS